MSEFLASNEWKWRLARTIVQGVVGVLIANVDLILGYVSHTCPFCYEPTEAFLPGVGQSMADSPTEVWLDRIERHLEYKR